MVHFLELWGNQSNHSIVFVEPDFPYLEALAPYQPLAMKVVHCPIDTSLSFTQANKLIRDLKPAHLLVPDVYLHPPKSAPLRSDLVIQGKGFNKTGIHLSGLFSIYSIVKKSTIDDKYRALAILFIMYLFLQNWTHLP